ncbi:2-succinyl-5-enolpyruvyl-6-hydroxy-3-cyclohexene-1-carboxylate synthase, partial [Staphylococcus aureus]|nr:2-succinyl-5-enolpyruvyl-6-hydroxy-3-cyclohexene-1-carboxylate synthase [Staphylococcus aureus]
YTAKLYQFDFKRFNSVSEFKNATLLSETSTIYELITNREDNFKQHQILYQKLSEMIHDTL